MNFEEFKAARQLLAEQTVGRLIRQSAYEEDAQYQESLAALRGQD